MSELTLRQRLFARYSKHFWTKIVPITNRMSPKMIARFAGSMGADEFAQIVAQASDEQLETAMQGRLREVMLDEIVSRMEDEFAPERADDLEAVIQFDLEGRPDGGADSYQITITNNTCATTKGTPVKPTVTVTLGAADFLKMTTGVVNGVNLYLTGKLKMDGAMMLLTRLTTVFNIPTPDNSGAEERRTATAAA